MALNFIFIISNGNAEKLPSYYYEFEQVGANELYDTTGAEKTIYFDLFFDCFPIIKKNQLNKYIKENKSFFIASTVHAYDNKSPIMNYENGSYYDLYISEKDIIKIEEREERQEMRKGCIDISKYYDIELAHPVALCSAYELRLYKDFGAVPEHLKRTAKDLKQKREEIEKEDKKYFKKNKADILKAYDEKIAQGFTVYTIGSGEKKPSAKVSAGCGVVRYEKSTDYLKAEKINKIINSCCYNSNQLSIYEVLKILEKLNITTKRGAK